MKESVTYQAIVEEGLVQGLEQGLVQGEQNVLLRQGRKKFGVAPDARVEAAVRSITDLERLNYLTERLLDVSSWEELLVNP